MKYEVFRDDNGQIILQLGTHKNVTFDPDCSMEDVVLGTTMLVENVVGTPILEMASTVMTALGLLEEPENDTTDG